MENLKKAAAKGAKAVEYKRRDKQARGIIARLKKELPDRATDRWVRTDEYIDALRVEYVRGSTKTKFFIAKVDPNFDFDRQEEVYAEELSRTAFLHPIESASPEEEASEDSLEKAKLILMTRMTRLKWLILSSD
ncbi:hypothetical protein ACOSP7_017083 [Xanthoceras sorbifolium]